MNDLNIVSSDSKALINRQISKKKFHLSPSPSQLPISRYYKKLEPVASMIQTRSQTILIPATMVSINEIIVWFTGRSKHTIMMRGKPCPVGYNILALCEAEYYYRFLFSSPNTGFLVYQSTPLKVSYQDFIHQIPLPFWWLWISVKPHVLSYNLCYSSFSIYFSHCIMIIFLVTSIYFIYFIIMIFWSAEQHNQPPKIGLKFSKTRSTKKQLTCHSIFR